MYTMRDLTALMANMFTTPDLPDASLNQGDAEMMAFFQGIPVEQAVPGTLNFPGSPPQVPSASEEDSETSMSEVSFEHLVLAVDMWTTSMKTKKSKCLIKVFKVLTGKKNKSQPSTVEPDVKAKTRPGLDAWLATVEELKADLDLGRLEASGPLLALERELLVAAAAGGMSQEELVQRQSKVEALYILLRDLVLGVLWRPLEVAPERLRQALAIVSEQELEDRRAAAGSEDSVLAPTRPRRWLQLWRRGVAQVAEERLGGQPAAGAEGLSEAERAFLHLGRTMKEDLEAVVELLLPVFPAEFHVVAAYAESYHEHFAAQLAAMAQFELCERDTYMLLVWVQNLYPNDIISSPKLAAELQDVRLGSLLPPRQIRQLEATFLSDEAAKVKELMGRALELESQDWAQDVPPQRVNGHCHSELASHVMQIISQRQIKAKDITTDLGMQIKQVLLMELAGFFRSYQRAFDKFLERCKQTKNYKANVIANINNCLSFRMSVEQMWQTPPSHVLGPLNELKARGFDSLLQSLLLDLEPLFKRFSQIRWAAPEELMEEILATVAHRLPEFSELQDCFQEELMEVVHLHLVKEYIICLSKRHLVLKTAEHQQQLAGHILYNAALIQHFCTQNGSHATWLDPAIPRLAEIIRLQDPSAIKMEVATYATLYPDFSKDHLSAILVIKGNLSSSEARSILSILDISTRPHKAAHSLFAHIKVG
ncbi:PREDICTED: tumor necrosis factor alpha-induced protein 2-like [Chrysochloris asiatica]|uniref:Tumor necrosis factor alpha-induced protein 2 n=1 Tax=Chrysochloris asiatica TaxID=185453 RepID=A0A9B0T7E2_CHRAS|nr:PREDICTED: tumor necrosis factor alpha-induced protein 2-like [Chrysochloris asiatica]